MIGTITDHWKSIGRAAMRAAPAVLLALTSAATAALAAEFTCTEYTLHIPAKMPRPQGLDNLSQQLRQIEAQMHEAIMKTGAVPVTINNRSPCPSNGATSTMRLVPEPD
jgi:hypothetical protein